MNFESKISANFVRKVSFMKTYVIAVSTIYTTPCEGCYKYEDPILKVFYNNFILQIKSVRCICKSTRVFDKILLCTKWHRKVLCGPVLQYDLYLVVAVLDVAAKGYIKLIWNNNLYT